MKFAALALAVCLSAPLKIVALTNDVQFEVLATTIPRAISDHSASVHNPHGTIYIAGGCDDPLGNTFDANANVYACNSISSYVYKFDAINEEIVELPQMPRRRYRHASAIVNNQLWILGGRDFFDTLIPEIDVSILFWPLALMINLCCPTGQNSLFFSLMCTLSLITTF